MAAAAAVLCCMMPLYTAANELPSGEEFSAGTDRIPPSDPGGGDTADAGIDDSVEETGGGRNVPASERKLGGAGKDLIVSDVTGWGHNVFVGTVSDRTSAAGIRPIVLTEETKQDLAYLDALQSPVETGVYEQQEMELLGDATVSAESEMRLKALLEETRKKGFHIGIVMIDISTGRGIAVHPKREFYSASSVKGPFVISLAALRSDTVESRKNTFLAIAVNSDNAAYSGMVNQYSRKYYNVWCDTVGAHAPLDQGHYACLSAEALARLWLLDYQYITTNSKYGKTVGEWFETPHQSAIHPVLKDWFTTQTKGGWIAQGRQTTADAGIVYAGDHPYVIALISDYPSTMKKLEPYVSVLDTIHREMTGMAVAPFAE